MGSTGGSEGECSDMMAKNIIVNLDVQKRERWWRDELASLTGTICNAAGKLWIADPRGVWPERWEFNVPKDSTKPLLGSEPKGPFHKHAVVECKAGEVLL